MTQWAIHNVKSIRSLERGGWEMETPRGKAILIPPYEQQSGILDRNAGQLPRTLRASNEMRDVPADTARQ